MGNSIVRKTDRALIKRTAWWFAFQGQNERISQKIVVPGKEGFILVHVGTNNAEMEGTTAIIRKYRLSARTAEHTRVEQIILSGILPVMGSRDQGFRYCRRSIINTLVQQLCREEEVAHEGWASSKWERCSNIC